MQHFRTGLLAGITGLCLTTAPCFADDTTSLPEEKEQLLDFLETQTELATKTRLNADYVPGIMTVIRGDQLESKGARTVWDALGFVPGIKPVIDHLGHRRSVVRGVGAPGISYQSGNLKFLLNGVAMNTADKGLADSLYYIPIEQVDRIEVIRGPGSAIHGEYALSGVINIITYRDRDRVYAFGGEFGTAGGGISLHGNPAAGLRVDLSLSAWKSDGADVQVERDGLTEMGAANLSNAPGEANEGIVARDGVLNLEYRNLSLSAQWAESRIGDYFGINQFLPPSSDREVERSRTRTLELGYRIPLANGDIKLFTGTLNYLLRRDDLYAPFWLDDEYLELWVDNEYEERKRYVGAELTHNAAQHTWLFGAYQSRVDVHQANQSFNGQPAPHPLSGTERDTGSFVLQDEYRAGDRFTLTGGVRYDHYSGIGTSLTPRLAGVWRISEQRVVKAQYGRAFRPPTFTETAFGAPDLDPVIIDTVEVGYIAKAHSGEWRATVFYNEFEDLIVFDSSNAPEFYANTGAATSKGIELEGTRRLDSRFTVDGSVSYARACIKDTSDEVPGSSNWLVRAGLGYRFAESVVASAEYRYTGPAQRERDDSRDEMDGFGTVDLTLSTNSRRGFAFRAGVSNLFDSDVRYPTYLFDSQTAAYQDDLPRSGRTWWIQASRDF